MGHAHRFALATAQAMPDLVVQKSQLAGFENDRLLLHQLQRGGIGAFEPRAPHQFATVEMLLGIDGVFIGDELFQLLIVQVLDFSQPNAVFSGYGPVQRLHQCHDTVDDGVRLLQHAVVV